MRISEISLSRFRSIIEAEKISLSNYTILVGRNNEGKSNILKALDVAIASIRHHARGRLLAHLGPSTNPDRKPSLIRTVVLNRLRYNLDIDFPIQLKGNEGANQKSRFRINFSLDDIEVDLFYRQFGSRLNGILPIRIEIGPTNIPEISILKQGKGGALFRKRAQEIAEFVSSRLEFNYISAVRTDEDAMEIIKSQVGRALRDMEEGEEYRQALERIMAIRRPALEKLANDVCTTLRQFVPSVKSVSIDAPDKVASRVTTMGVEFLIDDGVLTPLQYKGDGIKSLVALSLSKYLSNSEVHQVYAIEEPESHLHPGAIHELRDIITGLSGQNQVLISTHNPIFVDRNRLSSMVIVDSGRANKAVSIEKIRQALGVHVGDNLHGAELAIICEGHSDQRILRSIIAKKSRTVQSQFERNGIIFQILAGASNLSYQIAFIRSLMFKFHVVMDYDEAGKLAIGNAENRKELSSSDYTYMRFRGNTDSEIEDCVKTEYVRQNVFDKFGVDITNSSFRGNRKWSHRMKKGFQAAGKDWNVQTSQNMKDLYAGVVEKEGDNAITVTSNKLFDSLAEEIESKISRSAI